jgi:hypothetical protein
LSWRRAFNTAIGMSFMFMIAMEGPQNLVDYQLTGGVVAFGEAKFWFAAALSMCAGFLVPFPYSYVRLRKYGKSFVIDDFSFVTFCTRGWGACQVTL